MLLLGELDYGCNKKSVFKCSYAIPSAFLELKLPSSLELRSCLVNLPSCIIKLFSCLIKYAKTSGGIKSTRT